MTLIHPLILCGGSGTRLWPASRRDRPKQFLPLIDGRSPFQETLLRVSGKRFGAPTVIVNSEHRFLAAEQAAEAGVAVDLLLEPEAKDSGPALLAGAAHIAARAGSRSDGGAPGDADDPIVLALAADHLVHDADGFGQTCATGLPAARAGAIVLFGVTPDHPSTAYGYIVCGEPVADDAGSGRLTEADPITPSAHAVARFHEKPDAAGATELIASGALWNSGNFLARASVIVEEYRAADEASAAAVLDAVEAAIRDLDFIRLDPMAFRRASALSFDHAVMERTSRAAVVHARFDWRDIGDWNAVAAVFPEDERSNAVDGDAIAVEASGCVVHSSGPLVAAVGVENLAIVVSDDAVLVMDRARGDLMRETVARVAERRPALTDAHRQSFRPWGNYRSLDVGTRHQVKRIVVTPGAQLSLQHHHHRSEHWVVVRGTARVTVGEDVRTLHENESVYIPIGATHRMENPGRIDLEIIEVQTGSYLGEDDIVRVADAYQRA